MLAARDQENLVARHQNAGTLKQQQNGQIGNRYPKTPIKIPLNDENAGQAKGGAKSILGNRTRGNENATSFKGLKNQEKSAFVTPMEPRARAVLGDKTTNAKTRGLQTVNAKSTVKEIEKSKAPTTVRPKQKQPQIETQKLQVHAEEADPLSEEEVEYCPPRPKELPYESDVFPDGVITFEGMKRENLFKGFYQHYFNPIDDDGVSKADREHAEKVRKALEESERQIFEDIKNFEWPSLQEEDDLLGVKKAAPVADPVKLKARVGTQPARRPLGTVTSRTAATTLSSMDDGTKSLQRKSAKTIPVPDPKKKATSFAIPRLNSTKQPNVQPLAAKRTPMSNIEANSRSTLGYNKGRAAASALAIRTTKPTSTTAQGPFKPKVSGLPRSATTSSTDSDQTITPSLFANKQAAAAAAEDEEWKERVPFLSIFNPEDDGVCDFIGGPMPELEDEEFEMQLPE